MFLLEANQALRSMSFGNNEVVLPWPTLICTTRRSPWELFAFPTASRVDLVKFRSALKREIAQRVHVLFESH